MRLVLLVLLSLLSLVALDDLSELAMTEDGNLLVSECALHTVRIVTESVVVLNTCVKVECFLGLNEESFRMWLSRKMLRMERYEMMLVRESVPTSKSMLADQAHHYLCDRRDRERPWNMLLCHATWLSESISCCFAGCSALLLMSPPC